MVLKKETVTEKISNNVFSEKTEEHTDEMLPKAPAPNFMQVVEVEEEPVETKGAEPQKDQESVQKSDEIAETQESESPFPVKEETPELPQSQKQMVSELFAKDAIGYPDISMHKKPIIGKPILWAIAIIIVALGIGLILVGLSKSSIPSLAVKPTPTAIPLATSTPTPTPTVNKSEIKIQILNGSGKVGVANTMKTLLTEKGYTVVGTGNAKTYDYDNTEIQVVASLEPILTTLKEDIAQSYVVGSMSASLKEGLSYSAVIIIGKE